MVKEALIRNRDISPILLMRSARSLYSTGRLMSGRTTCRSIPPLSFREIWTEIVSDLKRAMDVVIGVEGLWPLSSAGDRTKTCPNANNGGPNPEYRKMIWMGCGRWCVNET